MRKNVQFSSLSFSITKGKVGAKCPTTTSPLRQQSSAPATWPFARLLVLLFAGLLSNLGPAAAQTCATGTVSLSYSTRPAGENWKNRPTAPVPAVNSYTQVGTSYTSTSAAGNSTLQTANLNGVQTLSWSADYTSSAANSSSVTYTFSRAVSNLVVRVQDVDAVYNNGILGALSSGFRDEVTFTGVNGGSGVMPVLTKQNTGSTFFNISSNVATANDAAGDNTSANNATVIATYGGAVTSITIQYRNITAASILNNQSVGIDQLSWCRVVPVANNVTTGAVPSSVGTTGISTLSGYADGTPSYVVTSLPANGTLFYNTTGTTYAAVALNQSLTVAQGASLRYTPDPTYSGPSTTFTYQVKDDVNNVSNTATYTIPLQFIAACATTTNALTFSGRPNNEDWKAHTALAVPATGNVTTITSSAYAASAATTSSLQIGMLNTVSTLNWTNDYSGTGRTSTVTFTFSRAVSNFTVRVQDIDASGDFIDNVVFNGTNAGAPVTPFLTAVNPGAGVVSISGNTATGLSNTDNNQDGTVTAYFSSPITSLQLTYNNNTAVADPANQSIGIEQMAWCRQAPLATNVTSTPVLATSVQANISGLASAVDGAVASYTVTSLPANGMLYYNTTGTTYAAVALNQSLTAAQAASLRYTANPAYAGASTSFTFKVTDDAGLTSANTATYTIPLVSVTPCATTTTLNFPGRPASEDWKAHATLAVPATSTLTTISSGGYAASASNPQVLQIGTINGVNSLFWNNDYTGLGRTSTVTFTFSRAVSNFMVRVQDIDAATDFIDNVVFTGANGGTSVTPVLTAVNPGAGVVSISGNAATGLANTDNTTDGTVTAFFPSPVTSLTITYNNNTGATDPANQAIGIDQMTWCRQAPVASNITSPAQPGGQGATSTAALSALADGTITSYTITALPPASQGTYYVNGVQLTAANFPGLVLTPTQATQLSFAPAPGFSGNAGFSYTALDDASVVSNTATYTIPVLATGGSGTPAACATPGKDGAVTITVNPDTYYPGTASATAGATTLTVGTGTAGGAAGVPTGIVPGDLLLVMQMQGADINFTNTDSYGNGVSGGGASGSLGTNFAAGTYEYVTVGGATSVTAALGGTITLTTPLVNGYANAVATTTAGPRRFQVIRIPQFTTLTLGGNITALPWNGSVGGVLAIDVSGQTSFGGNIMTASARGFRGGGGRTQTTTTGNSLDYVNAISTDFNAQKGEGTAGTPRYVNQPTTNSAANNVTIDTGSEGYPGGSSGRGAPGNAGGGGNNNIDNSGGGGGANGGNGGRGGNNFASNLPIGGEPGAYVAQSSSSRLLLGGGGGAGTTNNNTGTPTNGQASSGAPGGGIVLLRTGSLSGTGTINANGGNANTTVADDGGGGGGAGGSILVTATNPAGLSSITLSANGGTGGITTGGSSGPHGPGGGGGGGVVLANAAVASASVAAGASGTTQGTPAAFGAAAGLAGVSNLQISTSIGGSASGSECLLVGADVTTVLTGPSTLTPGQSSGTYTATFLNEGPKAALSVTRLVTLPAGATNILVNGVAYTPTTANTIDFGTAVSLSSGEVSSFTFSFTPSATATGPLAITSTVGTTSNQGPALAPDNSTISATVPAVANVAAAITAGPTAVAATPGAGSFTATFSNSGPTAAQGVVATVQLPAGLTNVVASNSGIYNSGTGLVSYASLTTLASGASSSSTITYDTPVNGPVVGTASLTTTSSQAGQVSNDRASASQALTPAFDLRTTLSGPANAVPGNLITLSIATTNAGPSAAPNLVQTAQLPTGLSAVYVSNGGTYNGSTAPISVTYAGTTYTVPAGGVIYPPLSTLPISQAVTNTVSFVMPTTGFVPTATSAANGTETIAADNTAFLNGAANSAAPAATLSPTPATGSPSDVFTRLVASAATVSAGSAVTLTVTTGNNGPGLTAASVVQTVQTVPGISAMQIDGQTGTAVAGGLSFASGATYSSATGMVTFPAIAPASGSSVMHTIAFLAPASGGNLMLSAAVTEANADPVPSNNVASTAVGIIKTADIQTNLVGRATAPAGSPVTYTASFIHNGPLESGGANTGGTIGSGIIETAQLPVGLTNVTITDPSGAVVSGASYNAATGLVTFPTLLSSTVGNTQVYNINFPAPAHNYVVTSTAATAAPDGTPTNNSASVATTVAGAADLVTTVSGPATAPLGAPVAYSLATTNNGPSTATTVASTLVLPIGFTATTLRVNGQTGTLTGGNVTYTDGASYNPTTGLLTFASTANLPSGSTVLNQATFIMPNTGQVTGVATTTSAMADYTPGNNGSSVATSLAPTTTTTADLLAAVTPSAASAASVAAGAPVSFTATFTNNGPDAATDVVPTLSLPTGLAGVTVSNGGSYNPVTGVVTWPTLPNQSNGNVQTYTVALPAAPASGPLTAVTVAKSSTKEPANSFNNSATASVTITPTFDTMVSLAGPAKTLPGSVSTYTISTLNNGSSATAAAATQTVTLPAGLAPVAGSITGGGVYSSGTNTITWTVPTGQVFGPAGAVSNSFSVVQPTGGLNLTGTSVVTGEANPADNTTTIATAPTNQPPTAAAVVNALQTPVGSTAGNSPTNVYGLLISPLVATDPEGALNSTTPYTVLTVPITSQGTLYYNTGSGYAAVTPGQTLTTVQATTLRFKPAMNYVGNATFSYLATDDANNESTVASYTVPVGLDRDAIYTATPVRGGASQYQNGDVITYIIDPNGARYNSAGLVYNTSGALQTGAANGLDPASTSSSMLAAGTLPPGVALNPNTGQLYVSDRNLLPVTGTTTTVSIITTDLSGGVTTVVETFTLGAFPLPVELTVFTAKALRNVSSQLDWATASEKNNDHFDVERSLNGRDFVKIGEVKGQGSKTSPTEYALTDANVAKLASTLYYRLKQVDADGTSSYSPVRTVRFDAAPVIALSVYPNPASAQAQAVTLDLSTLPEGTYQATVLDATGRVVATYSVTGGVDKALPVQSLSTGTYLIQVRGNGLKLTQRLTRE
jgi:uncharacterized repeat protein (TIGR01451 family)